MALQLVVWMVVEMGDDLVMMKAARKGCRRVVS